MSKARIGKEVVARMPNRIGVLAEIAKQLSEKGINIQAVSSWIEGSEAVIRLVTEDVTRAADVLRQNKITVKENEVVLTELAHKPGMLRSLTEKLAQAGIDLRYLYASATDSQDKSLVVFSASDNGKALVLLNA